MILLNSLFGSYFRYTSVPNWQSWFIGAIHFLQRSCQVVWLWFFPKINNLHLTSQPRYHRWWEGIHLCLAMHQMTKQALPFGNSMASLEWRLWQCHTTDEFPQGTKGTFTWLRQCYVVRQTAFVFPKALALFSLFVPTSLSAPCGPAWNGLAEIWHHPHSFLRRNCLYCIQNVYITFLNPMDSLAVSVRLSVCGKLS